MKLFTLIAVICFPAIAFCQAGIEPLTIADLNKRSVIGELGIPLGTMSDIEAVVVSGRELKLKHKECTFLLRVTHVNGKELANAPTLHFFNAPGSSAKLAPDYVRLYQLKNGNTKVGSITGKDIQELEKGYVGKTVKLTVYERGFFHGLPKELPPDQAWPDIEFRFSTELWLLHERE